VPTSDASKVGHHGGCADLGKVCGDIRRKERQCLGVNGPLLDWGFVCCFKLCAATAVKMWFAEALLRDLGWVLEA
jgi:hypothetical protein